LTFFEIYIYIKYVLKKLTLNLSKNICKQISYLQKVYYMNIHTSIDILRVCKKNFFVNHLYDVDKE